MCAVRTTISPTIRHVPAWAAPPPGRHFQLEPARLVCAPDRAPPPLLLLLLYTPLCRIDMPADMGGSSDARPLATPETRDVSGIDTSSLLLCSSMKPSAA